MPKTFVFFDNRAETAEMPKTYVFFDYRAETEFCFKP